MAVFFTRTSAHARLLSCLLLLMLLSSLAFAQEMITNGSLTGTPANHAVPNGWSVVAFTPDINSIASGSNAPYGAPAEPWYGTPVASPDGGTFESLYLNTPLGTNAEAFGTTVTGLTIGNSYKFSYYYASTPSTSSYGTRSTQPVKPVLTITGLSGYTQVAYTSTSWNWIKVTQTLTATATTASLTFSGQSTGSANDGGYLSFDGVSLISNCAAGSVAPVPGASTLLVCGATANLTTLQSGTPPSGSTFKWHTGTPGTSGSLVSNPTAVAAPGTYYLTYNDATNNCFSPTSSAVTVSSATPATPAITAVDPTCTVLTGGISVTSPVAGITYTLSPGGATSTTGSFTGLAGGSGPYTVTASNGTCTSAVSNSVSIAAAPNCSVADLRPLGVMSDAGYIKPSALTKNASLRIFNVGQTGSVSSGPITVYIYPPNNQFSLALGSAPGWAMTYDAGGNYYTLTSTSVTVAYGSTNFKSVPLIITAAPATSKGKYNINFEIGDGSGGETNNLNNTVLIELTVSGL